VWLTCDRLPTSRQSLITETPVAAHLHAAALHATAVGCGGHASRVLRFGCKSVSNKGGRRAHAPAVGGMEDQRPARCMTYHRGGSFAPAARGSVAKQPPGLVNREQCLLLSEIAPHLHVGVDLRDQGGVRPGHNGGRTTGCCWQLACRRRYSCCSTKNRSVSKWSLRYCHLRTSTTHSRSLQVGNLRQSPGPAQRLLTSTALATLPCCIRVEAAAASVRRVRS
jgi:hypothetical protein